MAEFDECPRCGNSDTSTLGLKDALFQCENCGSYSCSSCKEGYMTCWYCEKDEMEQIGLIN